MIYKSFHNLLFDLKEARTSETKAKVFHEYFYTNNDYVEFICTDSITNDKKKRTNKIYYIKELINPLNKLEDKDFLAISDIVFFASINKKLVLTPTMKKNLVNLFGIYKSSDIKNILYFYPFIQNDIFSRPKYHKVSLKEMGINSDGYLSLVLSKGRYDELKSKGISKISEIEGLLLDEVEMKNIICYSLDLQKYVISDKLILSIIDNEYRDVVIEYLKNNTFKEIGKLLGFSTTKARITYYTAIKKVIDFFYTSEGVRALWLIFSHNDGYVSNSDLEKMFPIFHDLIKYIFSNNYIYHIKYDKVYDRYISEEEKSVIKLVGFDLDDTLLNSKKEIQDIDAVKELIDNGIKVCFCSGRPYVQTVKDYYRMIGLTKDIYYVAFNGVAVYRVDDDKLIYGNYLNEEEIERIASVFNNAVKKYFNQDDFAMYCYKLDNTVESTRINDYVLLEEKFNKTKIVVKDFYKEPKCGHKIMISGKPELINELFSHIYKNLSQDFEVLISMPFFIEVYKKNNDKYQSLLKVAKQYKITKDEIMTFGDSLNDYTLVKNGKIGIAMGNSVDKVKEVASFVTDDNDNYGVTKALLKYGLIKKSNH